MITRRSRLFATILSLLTITVAIYDEQHPPNHENFDPAEANPKMGLTCLGDHSRLNLPYSRSCRFDPNSVSMQKLCAKTQYHGGPPGQHLGGFCPVLAISENGTVVGPGEIAFDHGYASNLGARACIELLHLARLLLECRTSCFCNYQLDDPIQRPKGKPLGGETFMITSGRTLEIKVDSVGNPTAFRLGPGSAGDTIVRATTTRTGSQVNLQRGGTLSPGLGWTLSIDQANNVVCGGELPSFPLPPPYTMADFGNNQELCVIQLSGGNECVSLRDVRSSFVLIS